MPNYYGRTDPQEQYQGSGFNPLTGRLNGGQLVMEFINRLQALKEKKKQEQWQLEDRELQKEFTKARIAEMGQPQREYETPEQVSARELSKLQKQHEYKLKEIEAQGKNASDVAKTRAGATSRTSATQADKDAFNDIKRQKDEAKKLAVEKKKEYTSLSKRAEELDTDIHKATFQQKRYKALKNPVAEAVYEQEVNRLAGERARVSKRLQELADEFEGGAGAVPPPPPGFQIIK
jgi:chromosome segregation ATPase